MSLHRQGDEFSQRDLFGLMLLGVLSTGERVKRLASRAARRPTPFDEARDGAMVDFLLGLIAFHDRALAALAALAAEPRPETPDPAPEVRPPIRTLLR